MTSAGSDNWKSERNRRDTARKRIFVSNMAREAGACSVISRTIFEASTQEICSRFRLFRRKAEAIEPCQKRAIACNGQRLCCTCREGRITSKTILNLRVTQCRTAVDPIALTVLEIDPFPQHWDRHITRARWIPVPIAASASLVRGKARHRLPEGKVTHFATTATPDQSLNGSTSHAPAAGETASEYELWNPSRQRSAVLFSSDR